MALTQGTDPISVSLTLRDNNANQAQFGFYTPNALTLAQIVARAQAVRDALEPLTNASIVGASISVPLVEDDPNIATPESEVERKLVLIGRTSSARQKPRFFVPSPVFSIEQVNTDEVSLQNPLVAALVSALASGILGPGNGAVAVSGLDVEAFTRAYIKHFTRETGR